MIFYCFSLSSFRPHKTAEKATASAALDEGHSSIQIKEVYKPKGAVTDLFKAQGQK